MASNEASTATHVSLGDLVKQVVTIVAAALTVYGGIRADLARLTVEVERVRADVARHESVLEKVRERVEHGPVAVAPQARSQGGR